MIQPGSRQAGVTLVELLVTMVVGAIAVAIILNGYTIIVHLWNNYSHKVEASDGAWVVYLKVNKKMSEARGIKKTADSCWVFYKTGRDSSVLTRKGHSLVSSDSVISCKNTIDSFSLVCVDTSGLYPVWECRLVYSNERKSSGMDWVTPVGGNELDTTLPTAMKPVSAGSGLYWDDKSK